MKEAVTASRENVFCGSGNMASAMREYDWENSALGPVAAWPETLKTSVRIMLASAYPMFVWWGPDMIMLYNDGYMPVLGVKHPKALGQPAKLVWPEIWNRIGPVMENVLLNGETYFEEHSLFYIQRKHFKEETYYTYSYSPILQGDGTIGGIFCACYEDTAQVLNKRRLSAIRSIAGISTDLSAEEARLQVKQILSRYPEDISFAMLYTVEGEEKTLSCFTEHAFTGPLTDDESLIDDCVFDLKENEDRFLQPVVIPEKLRNKLSTPEHGLLSQQAVGIPVADNGQQLLRGYLVIGLSPVLPYDDDYRNFLMLLSAQVNSLITTIRTLEKERLLSRKLIELDKSKTTFFRNVSHEFRTPLTLILGPLEVLLNNPDEQKDENVLILQIMQRNAMRLMKQVNHLLNFSHVEDGRYNARFIPVNLDQLTLELASTFKTVMQQGGLAYTINCQPLSGPVLVDPDMWEMIVLNLISNAFKYTLTGSITVALIEKSDTVELHVTDTGIGIPEHDLPMLFKKFYRVEQNQGRNFEGSGIGLALVSDLVKLHEGSVQVQSKVGQGSQFIVAIPKVNEQLLPVPTDNVTSQELRYISTSKNYVSETESWFEPMPMEPPVTEVFNPDDQKVLKPTVLLADDNPDMLNYVKRLLDINYHVLTAGNGQEALELIQLQAPDLILSDVMMPFMDGVSLLHTVRNMPALATIPFILLSARAGEEDKFKGLDVGADDYLIKPFSARELVVRISSQIRNATLRNEWKLKEQRLIAETNQRNELLENILSSISDAFYHVTPDLEYTYVNNRAIEITGKTREEHIGRKVFDVYPYLADTELYQKIQFALQTMQPVATEHYDKVLDKWFDCRLYPGVNGSSAYFADITDRKLEEQARKETEKRFAEVANAAPVLIWMSGPDKLGDFFNDSWLHFRGRTMEEEKGYGWTEGVHPDDMEILLDTYANAFDAKQVFSIEYRLLNKNGEYRWLLNNGVPRITEDGQLLGYIGACTDITEFKWAASLMSKYNSELEKRVTSRTAALQLANERLIGKIEENKRKKEELVKSHEQLHLLTSHLQDLRENERKLIAREIHDELGQTLSAFKIEIMLLYDRIADSRSKYKQVMLESLGGMEQALNASLVSLRKIISQLRPSMSDDLELVYEIQRLAADMEKRTGFFIHVRSEVDNIELPPNLAIEVYRMIQESVTNIIKHAKAENASIEISKENDKFRFLVVDNGIGFDENALDGKQSFGMLGIKERAQHIQAQLNIKSSPGSGTTVELLVDATLNKTI
ncbi:response regulator [Pontibacter sp. BT310]|uniref:Oxygen sensor histidine kinase NreB n=1 Tax=Pontibacter populi TaxID=890055 RepID=A0ABS6XAP5_9BACT|nr:MULTISPECIES: ATP-binding protein [Pontibacter]MBJ6118212.1 response regulator [Pontibacter sp. BT310]MBR0570639.1 response regulator [Microvirga sp. STS03]MBW3365065.1 response regulator [Pontibacter populi]